MVSSLRASRRACRGTTLMEALVAVVLLSMCALAYAAMQMRGLSNNASSMWRSKAALLAYEMADRMRANQLGVIAGSYNDLTAVATAVTDCGTATACTPTRMALYDYFAWNSAIALEIPSAIGVVCLDSTPDDGDKAAPACDGVGTVYAVKLLWQERGVDSRLSVAVRP